MSEFKKTAFLFPGVGPQHVGMGQELYEQEIVFKETIDKCCEILALRVNVPLLDILYKDHSERPLINQVDYAHCAMFAFEVALVNLWKSKKVMPSIVMGHSLGEYAAAYVAGVLSLEDALYLVAERGRLMQALPENAAMVAVLSDANTTREVIKDALKRVSIAAQNSPKSTVISGLRAYVHYARERLSEHKIKTLTLNISRAGHSREMQPILDEFKVALSKVNLSIPTLPIVSNVTGKIIDAEIASSEYWCRHILQTVLFENGVKSLVAFGVSTFLELGPRTTLLNVAQQCIPQCAARWLPSLRAGQGDQASIAASLRQILEEGFELALTV